MPAFHLSINAGVDSNAGPTGEPQWFN
eukprot:COSAG02_NODE_67011_length_254_cov_0.645161_1_plen_26_part_01